MIKSTNYVVWRVVCLSFILVSCAKTPKEKAEPFVTELAMPNFRLATMQDSTMILSKDISKDGIVVLKYFSPDCDHCQKAAQQYVSRKNCFSNLRTIWMSGDWANLKDIQTFAETYNLNQTNPIYIGKDVASNLVLYFDLKSVPFAAVYKDNQLIKEYRNKLDFNELAEINNGTFVPQPKDSLLKIRQQFSMKR